MYGLIQALPPLMLCPPPLFFTNNSLSLCICEIEQWKQKESVIVSNENQDSLKTLLGKSPQPPDGKIVFSHPENAGHFLSHKTAGIMFFARMNIHKATDYIRTAAFNTFSSRLFS